MWPALCKCVAPPIASWWLRTMSGESGAGPCIGGMSAGIAGAGGAPAPPGIGGAGIEGIMGLAIWGAFAS